MSLISYQGYLKNGRFIPLENKNIEVLKNAKVIVTVLSELPEEKLEKHSRSEFIGSWKDKIWMSDDFNEPLEEMNQRD